MKELYLDCNAHLPPSKRILDKYAEISSSRAGHGHPLSLSKPGRDAAYILESSRQSIAQLIGAQASNQIILTYSCTQACEWGMEIFNGMSKKDNTFHSILCSPLEHPAIREPFQKQLNINEFNGFCDVDKNGIIKLDSLSKSDYLITHHVQSEIGLIQPIKEIKERVKFLFCDMSQSLGKIPVNVTQLDVDIAVFGAHKFGGWGGVGFMYLKDPQYWIPFGTGSRYFTDRTGTPDVASIAATAEALKESIDNFKERDNNCKEFKEILELGLKERNWEIIGENAPRSNNTTFCRLPSQAVIKLMALSDKGIYCGLGSACGSHSSGLSPSLKSLGFEGVAHDFMRISQWGNYNGKDAKYFLEILDKC